MKKRSGIALAVGGVGLVSGIVAERLLVRNLHQNDPESDQDFGQRRGVRSRRIELEGGARIFIEETGPRSKSGVVFVTGSGLRLDTWHYQMYGLGNRRLVFYDLRGHGQSQPKSNSDYTIARLAADLGVVIEDCGLEEFVVVGHSLGGMIAIQMCLNRPELLGSNLKGLGLLNTTYGPAVETLIGGALIARLERATRRPFDTIGRHARHFDFLRSAVKPSDAMFWGVSAAAFGPGASAAQIDFVYDMIAETPSDVIFDLVRSYRAFDAKERLDEIGVPCLVIGGDHDRLTLPEASTYLAEHLPKAELHILEDCGHMAMMERHDDVNEMLKRFSSDVLGKER
jgi:pimeloyl-ACP methyl ester carboxylesterase